MNVGQGSGALEVGRAAHEVPSLASVAVLMDGVQVGRIRRRNSGVFQTSAGVHTVQVRAGRILSPEAQVEVMPGETARLVCWTSPAKVSGRSTRDNWIEVHLSPTGPSAPVAAPVIPSSRTPRFWGVLLSMLVLTGLIAYLLVAGDEVVALVLAIPLIALVIWAACRGSRSRDRR